MGAVYRLVKDGTVTGDQRVFDGDPPSFELHRNKGGWQWLPASADPEHDPRIERLGAVEIVNGRAVRSVAPIPLDDVKAWADSVVDVARLEREASGGDFARVTVTVGDASIPVDTRDERDLNRLDTLGGLATLAMLTGDDTPFTFKDADNAYHAMTPSEVAVMLVAVAHAINQRAVAWSWQIKDAIASAESAGDVLAALEAEGLT